MSLGETVGEVYDERTDQVFLLIDEIPPARTGRPPKAEGEPKKVKAKKGKKTTPEVEEDLEEDVLEID